MSEKSFFQKNRNRLAAGLLAGAAAWTSLDHDPKPPTEPADSVAEDTHNRKPDNRRSSRISERVSAPESEDTGTGEAEFDFSKMRFTNVKLLDFPERDVVHDMHGIYGQQTMDSPDKRITDAMERDADFKRVYEAMASKLQWDNSEADFMRVNTDTRDGSLDMGFVVRPVQPGERYASAQYVLETYVDDELDRTVPIQDSAQPETEIYTQIKIQLEALATSAAAQ